MAPHNKNVKTYDKRTKSAKSFDALNALLAENLTKRLIGKKKSKRIKIKELPPRTSVYLSDDSLKVKTDDTFDKILKGKVYNEVKVMKKFVKVNSSESDVSRSRIPQVSVSYHSPIMTRERVKQSSVIISEITSSSKESSVPVDKSSTLSKPVTISLQVEKENKKLNFSSLSYIQLPKIVENRVVSNEQCLSQSRLDLTYEPMFSDTFRERHTVHSSTPCVIAPVKIVADPISPIRMIASPNSSKLIKKSYDEIKKWDSSYPVIEGNTPKGPVLRSSTVKNNAAMRVRRRKLSSAVNPEQQKKEDWKLHNSPKVYIKSSEVFDYKEADGKLKAEPKVYVRCDDLSDFRGFTDSEQSNSDCKTNDFREFLNDIEVPNKDVKSERCLRSRTKHNTSSEGQSKSRKSTKNRKKSIVTRKSVNNGKRKSLEKLNRESVNANRRSSIRTRSSSISVKTNRFDLVNVRSRQSRLKDVKRNSTSAKKTRKSDKVDDTQTSTKSESPKKGTQIKTRAMAESTKRYITLRRKIICCDRDNSRRINKSRKTKQISSRTVNVTEEILSEKEVSCSRSNTLEKSAPSSINTSLSNSFQHSVVSYSCEDLNRDLEINLPVKNGSCGEIQHVSSSTGKRISEPLNLSVDQKEFDNFTEHYFTQLKDESLNTDTAAISNSSSSTSVEISDAIKLSKVDEESVASSQSNISSPEKRNISTSKKATATRRLSFGNRSSLSLSREKTKTKRTPKNVVVLSNITLHSSPRSLLNNNALKTYMNIWHDHSYSSSPVPKQLHFHSTPVSKTKRNSSSNQLSSSHLSDIIESSVVTTTSKNFKSPKCVVDEKVRKKPKSITLKPGKSYRRSLSLLKRCSMVVNVLNSEMCRSDCTCSNCVLREKLHQTQSRRSSVIVPAKIEESPANQSILEVYARNSCYVQEQQKHQQFIETELDDSVRNLSLKSRRGSTVHQHDNSRLITAKDIVLRKCGQTEVLPFEKCYPRSALQHCQKIGEGVYGEVFLYRNQSGGTSVMKIIPIEGDLIVNGEKQKKYEEIVTEIIISTELSNLRNNKLNCTSGFSEVKTVRCVQGCYPDKLLDLWELYDENHGSENDSPQIFPPDQMYIVLELSNGGQDLESYVFNSALQVFSMFKQTACALAVAETQLKFEHRDLHWGNVLLKTVEKDKSLQFRLNGKEIKVNTHGVEASIIDFTLSRIEVDGVVVFNDLSLDNDLFVAKGDYQFEIYRLMQKQNGNEWKHFEPYSNILWLHYLLDKAVSLSLRYKNTRSKIHKEYLGKLKKMHENILSFNSAVDFVLNTFI